MASQNHFDAIALLRADHRKVEDLFAEFEAANREPLHMASVPHRQERKALTTGDPEVHRGRACKTRRPRTPC